MKIKKKLILIVLAAFAYAPRPCNAGGFEDLLWSHKGKALGLAVLAGAAIGQEAWFAYQRHRESQDPANPKEKSIFEQIIENMPQQALNRRFMAEVEQENPNNKVLQKLADKGVDVKACSTNDLPLLVMFQAQRLLHQFRTDPHLAHHESFGSSDWQEWCKKHFALFYKNLKDALKEGNAQAVYMWGKEAFGVALMSHNLAMMKQLIELGIPRAEEGGVSQKLDAFTTVVRAYEAYKHQFKEKGQLSKFKELVIDILDFLIDLGLEVGVEQKEGEVTSLQLLTQLKNHELQEGLTIAGEILNKLQVHTDVMKRFFEGIESNRGKNLKEASDNRINFLISQVRGSQEKSKTFLIKKADYEEQYAYFDRLIPQDERYSFDYYSEAPKKQIDLGDLLITLTRAEGEVIAFKIEEKNGGSQ